MCRPYDEFKDAPFLGPITRRGVVWLAIIAGTLALYGSIAYALLA